jgi:Protein of unknown function (DUF1573)
VKKYFVFLLLLSTAALAQNYQLTAIDFGQVRAGNRVTQSIVLSNTGNADMTIGSIAQTGGIALSNNCNSVINPGKSCTVIAAFHPSKVETLKGTITITMSGGDTPTEISWIGQGI